MSVYDNCTGIAVPIDKLHDNVAPFYFIINNQGIFNYSNNEKYLKDILSGNSDIELDNHDSTQDVKQVYLKDYYINSGIKVLISESNSMLTNRSYFELNQESDDDNGRHLAVFSFIEENIVQLYDYVKLFCLIKGDEIEEKLTVNDSNLFSLKSIGTKSMRDIKHMEEVITKLEGKFVNQDGWDKETIRVINPTSDKDEYEETWVKLENGSDFTGQVKNGMPHGKGKEYRKDGLIYTGNFYQGKWHGKGHITNINLDNYQGEFIDGCICGI